jgi:D-alanyl-D-alanine carboxypeptidase
MRESVTKRAARASAHHRRMLLYGALLLFTALCALFLAYSNWRMSADIKARETSQAALFVALDTQAAKTKQAKIDAAKKAEAEAKANADEAEASREADAKANPSGTASSSTTLTVAVCDVTNPTSITVVVNKKHCFSPRTWEPSDLSLVGEYYMRDEAAQHMQAMIDAAAGTGMGFAVSSGYRSYDNQVSTYAYWVEVNGSRAEADKVSARPGYSEHQTGLVADLKAGNCQLDCFGTSSAYQWLVAHAAEYGFIQRYPEGLSSITGYQTESWHWRYVGTTVAQDMKAKGIQTLEQYFGITGGDY